MKVHFSQKTPISCNFRVGRQLSINRQEGCLREANVLRRCFAKDVADQKVGDLIVFGTTDTMDEAIADEHAEEHRVCQRAGP